jgi:nitrite reductase/ring-hydroxylating ferredoxin subunit
MTNLDETTQSVSRRMMIRGVTVGGVALPLLAACGGGDSESDGASGSASESATAEKSSGGGSGGTTVAKADVPVGSGVILKDAKVVVTQPADGEFKAFTAVCTHQGCLVSKLVDKKIHCDCHGSEFSIEDGKNVTGPNGSEAGSVAALASKKVTVEGDQISVS